jgi:F0F1-type ATP synthase membrane subunit b/b'
MKPAHKRFLELRLNDIGDELESIEDLPEEYQTEDLWERHAKLEKEYARILDELDGE